MSISDADKIDAVAWREDTSVVRLIISDHLDWQDLEGHTRILRDKIDNYVVFVESGQLAELRLPSMTRVPVVVIALICMFPPSKEAQVLLEQVSVALDRVGIAFVVE